MEEGITVLKKEHWIIVEKYEDWPFNKLRETVGPGEFSSTNPSQISCVGPGLEITARKVDSIWRAIRHRPKISARSSSTIISEPEFCK